MPVISEENNNNYFCNQIDQRLVFRLIVSDLRWGVGGGGKEEEYGSSGIPMESSRPQGNDP